MLQFLPDKEKLFNKVFIGINYQPEKNKSPLIVSGDFLSLILKQIQSKTSNLMKKTKKQLLLQILQIFKLNQLNSLHIFDYDKKREESLLQMLISSMISLIQNQADIQLYSFYLGHVSSYYLVRFRNVMKITQLLSKCFYLESFNSFIFKFAIKVLNIFFGLKKGLENNPSSFFYLYGDFNYGIKSNSNIGKLKNELSTIIVFKIVNKKQSSLLSIKFLKQEINVFVNQTIVIENQFTGKRIKLEKINLQENKWYRLIINFTSSYTKLVFNSQIFEEISLINKQSERQINTIVYGNKFSGFLSSLIVSSSLLDLQKFPYQQFPFGVQNWETLRILRQRNPKFVEKILMTSFPFCLRQFRYKSYTFDISQKMHSQISENIIIYNDDSFQSGPAYLGNPQIILPLFYLAKFYKRQTYPNLLNDLLQLIQTYIIKYNTSFKFLNHSSLKKQYFHQQQFINCQIFNQQFFIIMGNHIACLTNFVNQQTLVLMTKIESKLNDEQKLFWLKHVMWNISVFDIYESKLVKQFFLLLIKKYQNHKSISLKAFGLNQLLYWTVKHFQHKSKFQKSTTQYKMTFNCCLQHYVNESILNGQFDVQEGLKLQKYNYKQHYLWIQSVASIIFQYMLIDDINQATQILKSLLRFFMHKFSTCFYLLILKIIKRQILKFKNDVTFNKSLANKCQIIVFLDFLSEKTINCDLVTEIIYFSLFSYQYQKPQQKIKIIYFIVQLINRFKQLAHARNPIVHQIKKIRKKSADYVLIQKRINFQAQKINSLKVKNLQKISNWYPLLLIIKNFIVGTISDIEYHNLSYSFVNQDAFILLKTYFQIGCQQNKQLLLRQVQKIMALNKANKSFLVKSYHFNQLILKQLFFSSKDVSVITFSSSQMTNCLFRIFLQLFDHIFKENLNFNEYFYLHMNICKQSSIQKLNYFVIELYAVAFQRPDFEQNITLNQYTTLYLLFEYQCINKKKESNQQFCLLLQKTKIFCIFKIADKIKQFYIQNLQSIKKAFIIEKFQLNSNQKIIQCIDILYSNIQKKVPKSIRKASNLSNENDSISKTNLIKESQEQVQKSINSMLFDQNLNVSIQGQDQFWFDGIISKLTANVKIYLKNSNISRQKLIQEMTETYLNENEKKNVFLLQLYISSIMQQMNRILLNQNQKSKQNKSQLWKQSQKFCDKNMLKVLTDVICIFIIASTCKGNIFQNSKLLRQILFLISGFLYKKYLLQSNEIALKSYFQVWKVVICLIIHNYKEKQLAQKQFKTEQKSILEEIKSYQDLNNYALLNQINNAIIQTLQFFILDQKGVELIKVQDWNYLVKVYKTDEELFNKKIQSIITCNEFIQVLTLNNQIQRICRVCNKSNFQALDKKFKKASNSIQKRNSGQIIKIHNLQKNQRDILFDKENIIQEQSRLRYLHNQQCRLREFHSKWKKMWKKMRVYNQPYGLYMAMRNSSSNFQLITRQGQLKNFKFKVSKYTSKSLIQPILQAKVLEPWHVSKQKYFQEQNQMYSLVDMMRPDKDLIKKSSEKNLNYNLNNLWNLMLWKTEKQQKKSKQYHVIWIKGNIKAKGRILINKFEQIQFWYQSIKQGDSHLSFQNFSLQFNKQTYKIWPLVSIKKIWRRRYLMKYNALELQLTNSKGIFLCFTDKDEKMFLNQIQKIRQDKIFHFSNKIKLNKISIFQNEWYQEGVDHKMTQSWRNKKISNLNYLMYLNKASSRGIYDLSQYPVVPWVTHMTYQKQPKLRDLTKTMGSLGSQQRKNLLLDKYLAKDPFNPVPPFHFGTHYSSPGVVFNFLIRLSPFTQYCKHLQGGKFDIADRLFSSLINSWKSAFNQISDVRQLTPQFYYLPQLLLNLQKHNFGYTQSGQNVNNVQLPPWAAQNPYFFVIQIKQILQSQIVSQSINQWIDLIFGYKQRGQQASNNFNVYYYLTYQQYSNLDQQEDQVHKKSCQAQIVHFGQIPSQLFVKPHPKRLQTEKFFLELKIKEKYMLTVKITQNQKVFGIHIKKEVKELILIKKNIIQVYSLLKNPVCLTKALKVNFQKSQSDLFYLLSKQAFKIVFFNSHDYFIVYGYINNQFRLYSFNHGKVQKFQIVQSSINFIFLSEAEDLLFVGCQNGTLHVFQIQYQPGKIFWQKIHCQVFPFPISHVSQNDGFFIFSYGFYTSIYKVTRSVHYLCVRQNGIKAEVKLLRSFKNSLKVKESYIIQSPLYGIVIIDNAHIKVYSINGQFLKSINCSVKKVFMIRDNDLNDYLYFFEQQRIVLLSLPDLRSVSQLPIQQVHSVWKNGFLSSSAIYQIGWQY